MQGIVLPKGKRKQGGGGQSLPGRLRHFAYANRFFLGLVIVPTLIVALYYGLVASKQYESSADFVVRRAESNVSGGEFGQLLGFSFGTSATVSEAYVVQEYLLSHDAVARLHAQDNLVAIFRRPGVDWISRLWFAHPSPERLLKYYRGQVTIEQDGTSGITHLRVHTFQPQDSLIIARQLLQIGEGQINAINQRTYDDQVNSSKRELDQAENELDAIQTRLTAYRRGHEDIDPEGSGKAQVALVSSLTGELVQARAKLQAMARAVSKQSPQYQAMAEQVHSLEAQVAGQNDKIAGPRQSVATRLSDYEQLVIRREQVAKVYAAAAVRYEQSLADAKRKRLYLVRVVEPNLPVRSEFPKRFETVLTIFASLFFLYAIGWLLWAGVKEHSL